MASKNNSQDALEKIRTELKSFIQRHRGRGNQPHFDTDIMERVRLKTADMTGTANYELEIGNEYSHTGGYLHSAAATLILDMLTTLTFAPFLPPSSPQISPDWTVPGGVTRAFNLACLRPLKLPATVQVQCKVNQHGRLLSLAEGSIVSLDGTKTFFSCTHHKVTPPKTVSGGGGTTADSKL